MSSVNLNPTRCEFTNLATTVAYVAVSPARGIVRIVTNIALAAFNLLSMLNCQQTNQKGQNFKTNIKEIARGIVELIVIIGPVALAIYHYCNKQSSTSAVNPNPIEGSQEESANPISVPAALDKPVVQSPLSDSSSNTPFRELFSGPLINPIPTSSTPPNSPLATSEEAPRALFISVPSAGSIPSATVDVEPTEFASAFPPSKK